MDILLDDNNYILSYALIGKIVDGITTDDPENLNHFENNWYAYKFENGQLKFDNDKKNLIDQEKLREEIRFHRSQTCFPIVNRGGLWYDMLSEQERSELLDWYQAWLDAPETLIEPEMPTWLAEMV